METIVESAIPVISEKQLDRWKISPVFSRHLFEEAKTKRYQEFGTTLQATGVYPDFHAWQQETIDEIHLLHPSVISVDGDYYSPAIGQPLIDRNYWFNFPGNPFMLRQDKDLFIIAGDIPLSEMCAGNKTPGIDPIQMMLAIYSMANPSVSASNIQVVQEKPVALKKNMNDAIAKFADEIGNGDLCLGSIDMTEFSRREALLQQYHAFEQTLTKNFLATVAGITAVKLYTAVRDNPALSRRELLRYAGIGGLAMLPGIGNLFRSSSDSKAEKWRRPVTALVTNTEPLDFMKLLDARNAIVAIKLQEARAIIPEDEQSSGSTVVVWGNAHRYGKDVFNGQNEERFDLIRSVAADIFKLIREGLADQDDISDSRVNIVDKLTQFFGGTAILRVKEPPVSYTPEAVAQQIQIQKGYISPTIEVLVKQAAQEAGFI